MEVEPRIRLPTAVGLPYRGGGAPLRAFQLDLRGPLGSDLPQLPGLLRPLEGHRGPRNAALQALSGLDRPLSSLPRRCTAHFLRGTLNLRYFAEAPIRQATPGELRRARGAYEDILRPKRLLFCQVFDVFFSYFFHVLRCFSCMFRPFLWMKSCICNLRMRFWP